MTHFAKKLEDVLDRSPLQQVDLVEKSGLSKSTVSKLKNGAQTPQVDHMQAILSAIEDETDRKELVLAYWYDVTPQEFQRFLMTIDWGTSLTKPLSPELRSALNKFEIHLAEDPDSYLAGTVLNLAKVL